MAAALWWGGFAGLPHIAGCRSAASNLPGNLIFAAQMNVTIEGEELTLLPERALWWPAHRALILSDVHWGKSGHFRKHGYAIPGGTQDADAARLSAIIQRYKPERLIIAGDLFHSRHNKEVDAFGRWRAAHGGLHIDFIIGNHDILSKDFYEAQALTIHQESLLLEPFFISHDAVQDPQHFTIHGHIHPGVRISGIRPVSLPAFCFNKTCGVLPAFGAFTGCKAVRLGDYDRIFVIGEGQVLALKGATAS